MLAMEYYSSRILRPCLILTGTEDGDLFHQYRGYKTVHTLFTESHWMNCEIMVEWLKGVRQQMAAEKKQRVGVIVDKAPQHLHGMVLDYCRGTRDDGHMPHIYIVFIMENLTSILQPGDVYLNRGFKRRVDEYLRALREEKRRQAGEDATGVHVAAARGELVMVVAQVTHDFNRDQRRTRGVAASFVKCGMLPYQPADEAELQPFKTHLHELKEGPLKRLSSDADDFDFHRGRIVEVPQAAEWLNGASALRDDEASVRLLNTLDCYPECVALARDESPEEEQVVPEWLGLL
eukprot:GHVU01085051.1.p1 GENE.GHVU01085051.1~~GHVU01085051.1.p1  ORF type:complete len:291 (+),score=54.19 GHVU01085051.1:397-1269(+)